MLMNLDLSLSSPLPLSLSLSAEFLEDYLFLTVGRVGGATSDIQQTVIEIGEYDRRDKLIEILTTAGNTSHYIIILNVCTHMYVYSILYIEFAMGLWLYF